MEVDKENASPESLGNTPAQLTKMDQMKFMSLMTKAKKLTSNGYVAEALDLYKKAQKICYSEKLQSRIQKMEIFLAGKSVQGDQPEAVNDAQNHSANCEDVEMSTPKKPLASAENQRPLISQSTPAVNGDEVDDENKAVYLSLVAEAKRLIKEENISQALEMYKKAAEIYSGEKLLRKIAQMEEYLAVKSASSNTENHSSSNNGDIEMSTPVKSLVQKEENRPLISQSTPAVNEDEVDDESKAVYLSLVAEAKRLIKEENISQALEMYKKAAEIYSGEKLLRKISQMEEYLRENPDSKSNSGTDKGSKSASELTAEDHQRFNNLVKKAKQFATEGNVHEALNLNKQALQIYYTEKLEHRIKKMEEYLQQHGAGYDNTEGKSESVQGEKALRTPKSAKKKSSTDVDTDDQRKFNDLVIKAKRLAQEGNITEALDVNRQALKIHYSEKLQKRIAKMEEYLKNEDEEEEEDSGMIDLGHNFFLYKDLADKLYAHQREGVLWMWGLHVKRKGGILGDDMGLGKTIQVIAFLSGLFDMDKVKSVLIVMPVSVIVNWEKEFSRWAPGIRVNAYHGTKKEKDTALLKVQKRGGVLLTSYGLVVTSWEKLGQIEGREFKWDYMILDEGHKIKNPTKTTKGVHQIGAKNRIILTGTPIQNNLRELWSLFDFVHQGSLLGTSRTFKMEFENPITRARERDATAGERKLGMEMAESLKKIIAPYFLRRTKAEVTEKGIKKENSENPEDKKEKHLTKMPSLTRKNDFIVWLFLTPTQQRIYSDFLSLDHVKELLMTKKSPLVALTVLKKICDHPRLLSRRGCAQLGLDGDHRLDELDPDSEEGLECAANQIKDVADEILIGESGKVIVVVDLLDKMKEEGHRCLVFSQSRKMLDVIEQVIKNRGHKVMRLDGTVTQLAERDARIGKFQNDTSYSVFLLTTQVGGVGLTLTAADRVIIFDPSWNPATDAQAVDRVFRIGQDKNVVIYRLITCGTVEEKIYRRQIFKDSITRQTTGNSKNPYRYFTKQELRELFTLDNPRQSKTQIQLEEMHSGHRKTDPGLDAHVAFLYSLDIFGLSDHDLMFTQEKCDIDHPDDDDDSGRKPMDHEDDYIQHRVQKAQELIRLESDLSQNFNERSGNQQRTVDGGQSGMNRPFAQPWQNWNFQGNVKNEEDFDGSEDKQKPVKTEPTVSIKSESDSDVVDLTQIEDKDAPIDLTTPPESPKAKERHFHSPHSPPSNRPIKREPEQEDEGEVTPDVPPHSSPSKDLCIQIEEDSESATHIVEDFHHMSISESPQTSPVKVKREKVTPDENAQMNGGLDSSVKVKVKEEVMTSDTEDEGKQSSGSLDRSGNTSGHGTEENDDVFTEPSLAKGNLTSANENDVIDLFTNENEELATSANENEELTTSANENDVIDLSTNENEDTTTSANESGALSLSANENPGMRLLSNQNDKEDQYIPQPSVGLSRDEELPIINMVTPSKKGRRRSVSQSPWLKKTPKSGSKNVIREEILISPDFNQPMVDIRPTKHQHSPRNGKNKVNLDCTILSAFQDSPNIDADKSRSRSHENVLGMTFVGESPVADVQVTHLHRTVVQDSPNTSLSRSHNQSTLSFNQSTDVVLDSVQNTPALGGNSTVAKNSNDVIIGDSEGEETPKTSRYSKISRTSVNESESEEELPIMSFKKKKQGAIIDSEDSANEDDEMHDSASKTEEGRRKLKNRIKSIENSESDEESMEASEADSDGMEISRTQEDENMTGESLTDESEEEEEEITKSSKGKKKNYVSDDDEEEEDDEGDDSMSGFIVDDSDEELDEDEDEASHGSEDDDETDEDDRMGKGNRKGAFKKHSGSSGFSKLPAELQAQYKDLEKNSKHLYKTGQYNEALVHVLQALEIYPDENMQALALKIHQKMMS